MGIATKNLDSKSSDLANQAEVSGADDANRPLGATPQSVFTGRHDDGSDANETIDGLNESEEMTRHLAEDIPIGTSEGEEDIPVFERGRTRTDIRGD